MTVLHRLARPAGTRAGAPGVLRALLDRPKPAPGEACEMCSEPLWGGDHPHVVDLDRRGLLCACRACALLFTKAGAAQGRYRLVGDRCLRLEPFSLTGEQWSALQVPVGMAFFLHNSDLQRVIAFYPSPGGATESTLDLDAWQEIVDSNPVLASLEPDVEAALVRLDDARREPVGGPQAGAGSAHARAECFVVPIDRCYELVGQLRMSWQGFDGGREVRAHLAEFFDDVRSRSKAVGGQA